MTLHFYSGGGGEQDRTEFYTARSKDGTQCLGQAFLFRHDNVQMRLQNVSLCVVRMKEVGRGMVEGGCRAPRAVQLHGRVG